MSTTSGTVFFFTGVLLAGVVCLADLIVSPGEACGGEVSDLDDLGFGGLFKARFVCSVPSCPSNGARGSGGLLRRKNILIHAMLLGT